MAIIKRYKGFVIQWLSDDEYLVFTKDEWSMGKGNRYPEWEACSEQEAKDFIDSY